MTRISSQSAQADLAFMTALVQAGERSQMRGGPIYFIAGSLYGFQCLVQGAQMKGWLTMSPSQGIAFSAAITGAFFAALGWMIWSERKAPPIGVGGRAINAAFTGVGLANLALAGVFASAAIRSHSFQTWLLFPPVVFALQGAVWSMAFTLRRRAWLGVVAAGWFVNSIVLGFSITAPDIYVLAASFGMIVWMAIPGFVMWRLPRLTA
jgi:hypothetical protein